MISSMFKTRKPKQFSHQPRYYNPEKEEFENRYKEIEAEIKGESNFRRGNSSPNLKEKWRAQKKTTNFSQLSNYRLIIIAGILFLLAYYILFL